MLKLPELPAFVALQPLAQARMPVRGQQAPLRRLPWRPASPPLAVFPCGDGWALVPALRLQSGSLTDYSWNRCFDLRT
jgi:hypothetical protein